MDATQICSICCETYNKSYRVDIKCQYCEFHACRECVATHLLNNKSLDDPICMHPDCKKPWIPEFVNDAMYKSFLNGAYKKHREDVLFDRELMFMPATQILVERDIEVSKVNKEITQIYKEIGILYEKKRFLNDKISEIMQRDKSTDTNSKQVFVRACPSSTCRGFLSTQWKCGICETQVCKECHEIIEGKGEGEGAGEHVCDATTLQTTKMLEKDSKNCPKCASVIFKIDGCDQMFCTQCHTSFSWKTLQIEVGRQLHNPHYYDWLRSNSANGEIPREAGDQIEPDNNCDARNLPNYGLLSSFSHKYKITPTQMKLVGNIHQLVSHIQNVEMVQYREPAPDDFATNRELRKMYLNNYIDKNEFKNKIQQKYKKFVRFNEVRQLLAMFTQVAIESFWRLVTLSKKEDGKDVDMHDKYMSFVNETSNLKTFFNESSIQISLRWNCVSPHITGEYNLASVKSFKSKTNELLSLDDDAL